MLPVPSSREHITLAWLQEALKQEPFEVLSFSWDDQDLVGGGIGALSSLERISLRILQNNGIQEEELSLIIKTPPTNEGLRSFVVNEGFCQREFNMYSKLFPSWRRFQELRATPERFQFRSPKCYYAAEEGSGLDYKMILILEDLVATGYHSWTEGYRKGLRWGQARKVVKEMALFHAVGMAYKEAVGMKHYAGPEYEWLSTQSKDPEMVENFLKSGIEQTCSMLRKHNDVPEGLISDLESFHDVQRLQALSFPRGERLATITHQDLHVHNILWGNNRVAFLDFQGCSYASPMSDLAFFLLLCCDPELFSIHLPQVLRYYAKEFNTAMRVLDSDIRYEEEELFEDYHAALITQIIHIVMGSASWCFGGFCSEDTEERYKLALIDSYNKSGQHLRIETLEQFIHYFEESSSNSVRRSNGTEIEE